MPFHISAPDARPDRRILHHVKVHRDWRKGRCVLCGQPVDFFEVSKRPYVSNHLVHLGCFDAAYAQQETAAV
jgi:hypothetical protein